MVKHACAVLCLAAVVCLIVRIDITSGSSGGGFEVVSDESEGKEIREIKIRLPGKLPPDELVSIADKVKSRTRRQAAATSVSFFLPDMDVTDWPWSRVQYFPNPKLRMYGFELESHHRLRSETRAILDTADDIIGVWQRESSRAQRLMLYERDGRIYLTRLFPDWRQVTEQWRFDDRSQTFIESKEEGNLFIDSNSKLLIEGETMLEAAPVPGWQQTF